MVARIVESVFVTMMNLEVHPSEIPWAPSHDQLTSVVHLSGDWNGALVLECNRWQACRFAGRFLSTDPPDAVNDEVRDLLGELANMIGGNMKCAVVAGLGLSMPSVTDGSDCGMRFWVSQVHNGLARTHSERGGKWGPGSGKAASGTTQTHSFRLEHA